MRLKPDSGSPQRRQSAGKTAEVTLCTGLRSTRTTARQAVVWLDGRSSVRGSISLRKTHLTQWRVGFGEPGSRLVRVYLDFEPGMKIGVWNMQRLWHFFCPEKAALHTCRLPFVVFASEVRFSAHRLHIVVKAVA